MFLSSSMFIPCPSVAKNNSFASFASLRENWTMSKHSSAKMPDARGHFRSLRRAFRAGDVDASVARAGGGILPRAKRPAFKREFEYYLREFCGRPTPLYFAERLTKELGGAKIYLKREDPAPHRRAQKSTTPSARSSSPNAWARPASSPRPAPASTAWPPPPSPPCSD